jgi:hypothetical protein
MSLKPFRSCIVALDAVRAELLELEDEPLEDADARGHPVVLDERVPVVFTGNLNNNNE